MAKLQLAILNILNHSEWKHGVQIHLELSGGKEDSLRISIGAVYTTLDSLIAQGWVEDKFAKDPDHEEDQNRSGRLRRWFRLTSDGVRHRHEIEQATLDHLPAGLQET